MAEVGWMYGPHFVVTRFEGGSGRTPVQLKLKEQGGEVQAKIDGPRRGSSLSG